jgi:hypothetical protein
MRFLSFSLAFGLAALLPWAALGFSSDPASSVAVSLDSKVCLTNAPIRVTVTFTNGGSSALRGFFFTEQIPAGLAVTTLGVTLNGEAVANYSLEAGYEGDILPGYTPWRWRFETPTNFSELNPVPSAVAAQIVFAIASSSTGTFKLPAFSWAANNQGTTNAAFGCSETDDERPFKFVASTNLPLLAAELSTQNYTLAVDGVPNAIYLLAASADLRQWRPLATNLSPFTFTISNWTGFPQQFYRATLYTGISADLALTRAPSNSLVVQVGGVPGCSYRVERSLDLVTWVPITTNTPPWSFVATNVVDVPSCFYRAILLPPP